MRNLDACRNVPALADLIWSERALVERLHYKLVVANLILAADERDMVATALAEIEDAVGNLGAAERDRAEAIALVARDWHLPPEELTLARLAQEAPDPWGSMFGDHRDAFIELTDRISSAMANGHRVASSSLAEIRETLGSVAGPQPQSYTARGMASAVSVGPTRFDGAL